MQPSRRVSQPQLAQLAEFPRHRTAIARPVRPTNQPGTGEQVRERQPDFHLNNNILFNFIILNSHSLAEHVYLTWPPGMPVQFEEWSH